MLNSLGGPKKQAQDYRRVPSLATVKLPPDDDWAIEEARAAAERVAVIRAGRNAWQSIDRAECFEAWVKIGAALAIGREVALRTTGANRAAGALYSRAFNQWVVEHGFAGMKTKLRSEALELHTHLKEILAWRATLDEREQRRLRLPQVNVTKWKAATIPKPGPDPVMKAEAALRCFLASMRALSPEQQAPLWQTVQAQAAHASMEIAA